MNDPKPQKLIVYNEHLPYETNDEAKRQLSEIKYNLSRAVILKEINPGISLWSNRLVIFIRLHGRHFSKQDHVTFIELFYKLMVMPGMEYQCVKGFALLLHKLLKKVSLLSRKDLTLPWRPLYELVKTVRFSKLSPLGLEKFPSKLTDAIFNVVRCARRYFPIESTEEILLEFRPLLCPTDAVKSNAAMFLHSFLPTKVDRGLESKTHVMWLDELIEYWFHCTANNSVSTAYLKLFARVAEDNAGYIDWTPHIPKIFNTFLCALNLPVNGMRKIGPNTKMALSTASVYARWFVYMMGSDRGTVIFDNLEKMFVALKSFYHPSNYDKHSSVLLGFLNVLTDHFVTRLNHERFHKPCWTMDIPREYHITDAEIERYVTIVKDVSLLSIFSKSGSLQAALTLQNLSLLRADLVIPPLLQSTFEALETLVEPHQVTATLMCTTSVARPLALGSSHLPSAPTNILPLLRLVLPGIDPNDFRKSMCAFNFISAIISLIPLVNCMPALWSGMEMTEVEKELCLASEQFEDLILQFMDRCFVMVENSTADNIAEQETTLENIASAQDSMLGRSLVSTVQVIFMQCSKDLFVVALDALFRFVSTRVLEVDVAGKLVSYMCRGAARSRPALALGKMLLYMANRVKVLASVDGVQTEEYSDPELLWYLEMLSELVRCDGKELLAYKDVLKETIALTIYMKCKKAYSRSGQILKSILSSLTEVYIRDWRSTHQGFDLPPTEHFYIRDWGKHCPMDDLNSNWHTPTQKEMDFVNELLQEFLLPQFDLIQKFMNGDSLTRDELHQHLQIISVCSYGAANVLPTWKDGKVEHVLLPTMVARDRVANIVNNDDVNTFQSCVDRKQIAKFVHSFFEFMLKEHEDDTKSFRIVSRIYDILVLHNGVHWNEFNIRWKSATAVKKALADKLHGNKQHVRAVQIERVQLQHDMRVLDQHSAPFRLTDQMIVDDLVIMSTSDYAEVRIQAQKILFGCLEVFDMASRYILPTLLHNIRPGSKVSHEKLKGTLYILQYSRVVYLMVHDWKVMASAWLPIVQANQSEKPSIVALINSLIKRIQTKYDTMRIERKVDQDSIEVAKRLLNSKLPEATSNLPDTPQDSSLYPSEKFVVQAEQRLEEETLSHRENFYKLEKDLSKLLQDRSIHWRCSEMCVKLMNLLLNIEAPCSSEAVQTYLELLVNDSLYLRQSAVRGIVGILHQFKPLFEKKIVDYSKYGLPSDPNFFLTLNPGDNRPDNHWLQYSEKNVITCQKELDEYIFVDKTHWGYQTWPLELKVMSHQSDYYSKNRSRDKLQPQEILILDAFTNPNFLEPFFKFLSMEVKKGEDKFQHTHYALFKGVFRNFGAVLLDRFKEIITDLLSENVESKHRCASEIIAGLIRGTKNWNYGDLSSFWDFVIPQLKTVLASNLMQETVKDWAVAFIVSTESLDPNRFHKLFSMFLNNPLNGDGGSQGDANRLYIMRNTFGQQEWRLAELNHNLLTSLYPHLTHNFQNVREKVGGMLSYVLLFDFKYGSYTPTLSPRCEMFIDHIYDDIYELYKSIIGETNDHGNEAGKMEVDDESHVEDKEERRKRDRLAKTVLSFFVNNAVNIQPINKELYRIIPLLLALESREDDPEMVTLCKITFTMLASKQLPMDMASHAVQSIIEVCCNKKSWNLRKSGLNYLKMMMFHNWYILVDDVIKTSLKEMLIERLQDEQVEVREIASTLLSGLVHFGYYDVTEDLLSVFYNMARTKLKRKRHGIELTQKQVEKNVLALQVKHGGVLGLSAIVLAFPYDVCIWMPDVIIHLGNYILEVPQISGTAKKTLSEFRRTHHDNWHLHRQQFTDDQLSVLTDLLISPSYYA